MVSAARVLAGIVAACAGVAGCGALIGIEDRTVDPDLVGDGSTTDGSVDAAQADVRADVAPTDAAVDAPKDATANVPVQCGDKSKLCSAPAETCCVYVDGSNFTHTCAATCTPPGGTDRLVALTCARDADCAAGLHCCLGYTQFPNARAACRASCPQDDRRMCDRDLPSSGQCPNGQQCRAFQNTLTSFYGYCSF